MSNRLAAQDRIELIDLGEAGGDDALSPLVGESDALRAAVEMARRVSRRGGSNVLLVGETGTGKELFARAIHAASHRRNAPFVAVNSSAIPASLLESELFGHERGAFTGARETRQGLLELAGDGTLFLDEVSSLPLDLQPKLLRALEERRVRRVGGHEEIEIRCRVTAATNVPLAKLVEDGSFRRDLYYRLNVLNVEIPPLRERRGDVSVLADHFLDALAQAQGLRRPQLTAEAESVLDRHSWPGNVRELRNVLDRALVLSGGGPIHPDHLDGLDVTDLDRSDSGASGGVIRIPSAGRSWRSVEKELLALTLALTGGNKTAAAKVLGMSRPTIHRKIDEYGIGATEPKSA